MNNNLYETEIKPLLSSIDNLSQSELIFDLSKSFYELRKASNKQHFLDGDNSIDREELTAEIRRRAIEIVVECMGIVENIDGKKESED